MSMSKTRIVKAIKKHVYSYEEYLKLLQGKYGNLYTITKDDFYNRDEKRYSKFKCKFHGDFKTKPAQLLVNCSCKECYKEKRIKTISHKVKEFYGANYKLSSNEENPKRVNIQCNKHNIITTVWKSHLFKNKFICKECNKEAMYNENKKLFYIKANKLYNGFYSYNDDYITSQDDIAVTCPIHGKFKVTPNDHLNKHSGCPKCGNKQSNGEDEIFEYCKNLCADTIQRDKTTIAPYEIDILIPNKKIAVEYNGLRWHSEQYKDNAKTYHLDKSNVCTDKGFKLIHIFEDEWIEKQNIVKGMINSIAGINRDVILSCNCKVEEVQNKEALEFLDANYIKGKHNSSFRCGLYNKNKLVLLATFKKVKNKSNYYVIQCFCNKIGTFVVNGEKLLLSHFIKAVKPKAIIVYVDKRWSDGSGYKKLGFKYIGDTKPNYYYCLRQHRENKEKYTKKKLVEQGFDKNKTEHEIMLERGIYRIYDCGNSVYELAINS